MMSQSWRPKGNTHGSLFLLLWIASLAVLVSNSISVHCRFLETGEISKLGRCLICRTFFVKNRHWPNTCNPRTCGKTLDNRKRAEKKALQQQEERVERQRRTQETNTRARLQEILTNPKFVCGLKGNIHAVKVQRQLYLPNGLGHASSDKSF